jgi:hypothetical protein
VVRAGPPGPERSPPRPALGPTPGGDCLGIIAGLGRGAPGTLPGRVDLGSVGRSLRSGKSPRAAGGRGGIWPGPGRRACCMPCVGENGLLPGRGPAGLGARGAAVGSVGAGAVAVAEVPLEAPFSEAATSAGALGALAATSASTGGSPAAGRGPGRTPPDLTVTSDGEVTAGDSGAVAGGLTTAASAVGIAGVVLAVFLAAFAAALAFQASPCSSWRRRATGASTVEEADLTNSPMSLRASSTFLLGTPNSFASSWTLALATSLLRGCPDPRKGTNR